MSKKNGMRILFLFWLLMMFGLIYMLFLFTFLTCCQVYFDI